MLYLAKKKGWAIVPPHFPIPKGQGKDFLSPSYLPSLPAFLSLFNMRAHNEVWDILKLNVDKDVLNSQSSVSLSAVIKGVHHQVWLKAGILFLFS